MWDRYGSRIIPPGEPDPYGAVAPVPSGVRMPVLVLGPRDLQQGALHAALIDLYAVGDRTAPRVVKFYRSSAGLVCAVLSRDGRVGFGCARPDHGDAGRFAPTPDWRERAERELRGMAAMAQSKPRSPQRPAHDPEGASP